MERSHSMDSKTFLSYMGKINLHPTEKQLKQFEQYANYLLEYNEHTNLTAIRKKEEVYLKHFYDSLLFTQYVDLNQVNTLVDVGTGAGFPGLVLKIMYPHLNVTLIEANQKKCTFLKRVIEVLELDHVKVCNERSEEFARTHLDTFDVVTARAVTHLAVLSELCLPLVRIGGYFMPLKGEIEEELKTSLNIIQTLNGEIEEYHYTLPIEEAKRSIIKIKKTGKTPPKYPRTYDKMKKSLKNNQK